MILRPLYTLLALVCFTLESISGTGNLWAAAAPSTATLKERKIEPISFPLRRRTSSKLSKRGLSPGDLEAVRQHDLARYDALLARLDASKNGWSSEATKNRRAGWETLALSSYSEDSFYYITLQMGTPAVNIDVSVDTGSSDLWVQSTTCRSCNLSLAEPYYDHSKNAFDATQSSTYRSNNTQVTLSYGDGSALLGTVSTDTVSLGQFKVPQQPFILATQENSNFGVAGLIGLAWPPLAQSGGTPWWLNALSQFQQPEMSFYFAEWDASPTDDAAPGGQFTIGGRNTSLFTGDIAFVPLSSQDYWSVQLQSLIANDSGGSRALSLSGPNYANGIIDTGTTLIYGPADVINAMFQGISGAVQGATISRQLEGFWALPCASTANIQIQFTSNVTVTIPAANVVFASIDSLRAGYCIVSFLSSTSAGLNRRRPSPISTPAWIFGGSFLKSTYTVFRKGESGEQPSVGFAPLSGVNYQADGNAILGAGGDGVDGRIGAAGATVVGTGDGGGSGSGSTAGGGNGGGSTAVQGSSVQTTTSTAGGTSQTGTSGATRRIQVRPWNVAAIFAPILYAVLITTGSS